jgi:hypothetical protein
VLDGLMQPRSSISYVQMVRSVALYTASLLPGDSCERAFIGHLMLLSLSSSWRRLAFMCVFQVRINIKMWIKEVNSYKLHLIHNTYAGRRHGNRF